MMKYSSIGAIAVAAMCATLTLSVMQHHPTERSGNNNPWQQPTDNGYRDEHEGMVYWEWLRSHDPKTGLIPPGIRQHELEFAHTLPYHKTWERTNVSSQLGSSPEWISRGPVNIGGRTRAIGLDITDERTMLCGGASGGMWRSTNSGLQWQRVTQPEQHQSVTCVAQDTRTGKRNVWYYGTGELLTTVNRKVSTAFRSTSVGNGIYKSTDNGVSWSNLASTTNTTPLALDQTFDDVWNVITDPYSPNQDVVYAAGYGAIVRSTDGGVSWNHVLGDTLSRSACTDVVIASDRTLYASLSQGTLSGTDPGTKGIWRSTDGVQWTRITPTGFPTRYVRIRLATAPSNPNILYILAETPNTGSTGHSLWKYTYLTGNGSGAGGRWENRSDALPVTGLYGAFSSLGSYCLTIGVKPDNENMVFVGGTSMYRSDDGFASTTSVIQVGGYAVSTGNGTGISAICYPNHHPDLHTFVFSYANPDRMFTGDDGGIQRTDSCDAFDVHWTPLIAGYTTTQAYSVALDPAGVDRDLCIAGLQDNGSYYERTGVPANPWQEITAGDGCFCAVAAGGTLVYTSAQYGYLFRSRFDSPGNISNISVVSPDSANVRLFVTPFTLDPGNNDIMYLGGDSVLWRCRSLESIPDDAMSTSEYWDRVNNTTVKGGALISALAATSTSPSRLYFGTSTGKVYRVENASTVNSSAPIDITGITFPTGGFVSCIATDPQDPNFVLVSFGNYGVISLFLSTDGGLSWTAVSGNLEENADGTGAGPSFRWVRMMHVAGSVVYYVGTTTGLYSTTILNGMATRWSAEGLSSIGNVGVEMIATRASDGAVMVATYGHGIYETHIPTVSVSDHTDVQTDRPALSITPSIVFDNASAYIELSGNGYLLLEIIDAIGRQRSIVANGMYSAGKHRFPFSVKHLERGTYFCRMHFNGNQTTHRIIVQ